MIVLEPRMPLLPVLIPQIVFVPRMQGAISPPAEARFRLMGIPCVQESLVLPIDVEVYDSSQLPVGEDQT